MKRHPILAGLFIIMILFIVFLLAIFITLYLSGQIEGFSKGDKIAVIPLQGIITDSRQMCEKILLYKNNSQIKAIVLRIDSPGGATGPTQEIFEEVVKCNKVKKVVVSMGSVAASGGYYIACGAEKIVANPGTITGSIGVVVQFANIERLLNKIGLSHEVIKSGEHKDMGSITRPLTDIERRIIKEMIDDVHEQFVQAVSERRKIPLEKVMKIADGRTFTGRQALRLGLVDKMGNLQDAIDLAAELAGIEGKPNVIYSRERGFSIFDLIFGKIEPIQILDPLKGFTSPLSYLYLPRY
jgi:protease-4